MSRAAGEAFRALVCLVLVALSALLIYIAGPLGGETQTRVIDERAP